MSKAKEPKTVAAPIVPVVPPVKAESELPNFPPVEPIVPDKPVTVESVETDAPEETNDDSDTRNAFDPEEPVIKSGFARVQIRNFRGGYGDARFDDEGLCERISHATFTELATQFPGIDVEFAEEVND